MIYISVVLLIVAAGVGIFGRRHLAGKIISGGVGAVAVVVGIISFLATVPAGHVGVMALFGEVKTEQLREGLHFVNPLVRVHRLSVQTQTIDMVKDRAITALSSDGMRMPVETTIVFRLDGSDAPWIFQNLGWNYWDRTVIPASRAAIRESVAHYTAVEAYSVKRQDLADRMGDEVVRRMAQILRDAGLADGGVYVQEVLLRNIDLPEKVKDAIEDKLKAEQQAQRMAFVIEREKQEAQRKEIEARGIQKFQEIVRQGIDEQLLRWKGIEATLELAQSQNAKVVVVGGNGDGLPLILNSASK